jgi:lactose/L-arabinose transport system substrate-binding protein
MTARIVTTLLVAATVGLLLASLKPQRRQSSLAPIDASRLARPEQLNGHLTVWSWNVAAKSLRALEPDFRKRCPNVTADVQMMGSNVEMRLLLSLASGTGAPDVTQLQCYEAPRFAATGRLTDLTSVASKYEKDFPPATWANCVRDGKVYAIPWDVGPCAVFYKRDLFGKYGVDPAAIETWDDFIDAGKLILQKSGGRTKMMPLAPQDLLYLYEILLQQVDGQVFDDHGRIAVASEKSRQVVDVMRRMLDAGICVNVTEFSQEWMADLNNDAIATYPGAVWLGGTMKDVAGEYSKANAQWGVFPLPAVARGGLRVSNRGGSVLAIPDQSPNKEAAWAFIEFTLCTREAQVAQYRNFDLFPAYLPALEDPFFEQPDAFYGGQKVRALFATGVNGIPVLNRTANWVEAIETSGHVFARWAATHEDTAAMLDGVSRKLERRFAVDRAAEVRP